MFRNHFMRISVGGSRIEDGVFAGDIYAIVSLRVEMHVVEIRYIEYMTSHHTNLFQ